MRQRKILWAFMLGLTFLRIWAAGGVPIDLTYGAWRTPLLQWSSALATGAMAVGMIFAMRPVVLERYMGGLDKMYWLHKWRGIWALILSGFYRAITQWPSWPVSLGLSEGGGYRHRSGGDTELSFWEGLIRNLHRTAEVWGEWAFYAMCIVRAIALFKHILSRLNVDRFGLSPSTSGSCGMPCRGKQRCSAERVRCGLDDWRA